VIKTFIESQGLQTLRMTDEGVK